MSQELPAQKNCLEKTKDVSITRITVFMRVFIELSKDYTSNLLWHKEIVLDKILGCPIIAP
ncbi:MAG: hypothetical protein EOM67_06760 [Spirochaetia bacterium]|nr:hypothetical protein [Spirochaetia bacterium]